MKSLFLTVLITIGCIIVAAVVFALSGIYNVAADVPHWRATLLLLEVARERSISVHSRGITVPPLNSEDMVNRGFPHFHDMCRFCHGGPGYPREEFAEGLYPKPPLLGSHEIQRENEDRELYWIVKNGLKMTGMPSFGKTHSDEDIWSIVAFLRRLPSLDPQSYKQMVERISQGDEGESHHDAQESKDHDRTHGGEEHRDLPAGESR
jgi:mono/diheme cytochrome c family protein